MLAISGGFQSICQIWRRQWWERDVQRREQSDAVTAIMLTKEPYSLR